MTILATLCDKHSRKPHSTDCTISIVSRRGFSESSAGNTSRSVWTTETNMTEETQQLLENLRLKKMATILDQELENAKNNSPSYSEFLLRLLQAQWHERQEKCLQYRIRQARLPEQWTLESFPFKKQPGVSRRQIQGLAALEFIPRAENIDFIGPTGVRKKGLASCLLMQALPHGY